MTKVIREEFVCDEHAQTHDAPYDFTITIRNRETGEEIGTFFMDACKDVVNWYKQNARKLEIEPVKPKKRVSRKRTVRRRKTTARPSPSVVRRWAQDRNLAVSAKGAIPKAIMEEYAKAH